MDGPYLEKSEHDRLIALLTRMQENAKKLDTKPLLRSDLELVGKVARDAKSVLSLIDTPFGALPNRRAERHEPVYFLLGEKIP